MFNKTYGAGYRAGMSEPSLKRNPDGTDTFVLTMPENPFTKPWQFISNMLWDIGLHDGLMKRILNTYSATEAHE